MNTSKRKALSAAVGALLAVALLFSGGLSAHAAEWEMTVCADPNRLPFSNADGEGFDNRIASMLAEELDADLTYVWWPHGNRIITDHLMKGECDIVFGIFDGYEGVLNTLTYYQGTYAFVYRSDSGFEIDSLNDPVLEQLQIGVEVPLIPPHQALNNMGLGRNVSVVKGEERGGGADARAGGAGVGEDADGVVSPAIIDAVVEGRIDVAIVDGAVGGYFAASAPGDLEVVPVTPEIVIPPFLPMTFPITIAVRQGDQALRDRLDVALANRWEEIRDVLRAYDVPMKPLPKPML